MINRPVKPRVLLQNNQQKQQGAIRPFGNIVNRNDRLSHSPITKLSYLDKGEKFGTENISPQLYFEYGKKLNTINDESASLITPYETQSFLISNKNDASAQKKDGINRDRDFVIKVENINKIHEQINSLLNYVKNGESKSVCKIKQAADLEKSIHGADRNIQNIIKQKVNTLMNDNSYTKSPLRSQYKMQQSIITPITQYNKENNEIKQDKYYRMPTNEDTHNKKSKKQAPFTPTRLNNKSHLIHDQDSLESTERKNKCCDFNEVEKINAYCKKQAESKILVRKQPDHKQYIRKQLQLQTQEKTKQQYIKRPKTPTYSYNMHNKTSDEEMPVSKFLQKSALARNNKGQIDYDYEISKVKERIQYSELMTKKMEQRFLASQQKSPHLNPGIEKTRKYVQMSHQRPKTSKNMDTQMEKSINSFQHRRYEQNVRPQQRSHDFQIKVYPCISHEIQPQELQNKQQVCKTIAQKLSQQIKLDQKLRDARQIFNNSSLADKWKLLRQKLVKMGYSYTQQQLSKELVISPNESNPFIIEPEPGVNQVENLALAFVNSQEFWQKKLSKFIEKSKLQQCGFSGKQFDLNQRGYLTIEDIVCFVNLHSSNFFRNRDLVCLFKRMMALGRNKNGVDYENFINIIACQ